MRQKRYTKEVAITTGIQTALASCTLAIRSSSVGAITRIPRVPVCSIRTTAMAVRTAAVRSVWSWLFEHFDLS